MVSPLFLSLYVGLLPRTVSTMMGVSVVAAVIEGHGGGRKPTFTSLVGFAVPRGLFVGLTFPVSVPLCSLYLFTKESHAASRARGECQPGATASFSFSV